MEVSMGNCKYCGKPVGFLRSKHPECEGKHRQREHLIQDGRQRIVAEVLSAVKGSDNFDELEKAISEIEQSSFVPSSERKALLVKGWENYVEQSLEDGILDQTEEKRLVDFMERFSLSQDELDRNGAHTKTAKAAALRDVLNGIIPQQMSLDGKITINFQKDEQIVWAFPGSEYLEDKTRRQFVGGSQGVSVRLMKGLYYRAGAFKGHAIEHTERIHIDTGLVVVTNKNIYFAGPKKSIRLPYAKIVSFEAFSDAIGIMRDAANAKPQFFITGDGWFTYNLVTNLSQLGTSDISKKKTVSFEVAGRKLMLVAIGGENQENINYFLEKTLPQIATHLNINLNDDYMDEFRGAAYIFCLWAATKAMEPESKRMLDICYHFFENRDDFNKALSINYEAYNNIWDESAGANQQTLAKQMLFDMLFPDESDESHGPDERVNNISAMSLMNTFIFNIIEKVRKAKAEIGLR